MPAWLDLLLAPAFSAWAAPVSWLELAAFVLAIAMVACNIRVNPLGWPLAIASSLLYLVLFWRHKLYGDAALQIVFIVFAAWGWWQWRHGTDRTGRAIVVRELDARGRIAVVVAIALAWPAIGVFLDRATDTDVPWWDAFPTAASLVGQFLLGRKFVENWPTWLAVNIVATTLFAWKGLWLTALLYAIFAALSVYGWRAWLGLRGRRDAAEAGPAGHTP